MRTTSATSPARPGERIRPHRRGDGGAVLFVVMFVMFMLLGLGALGLWLSSANLQVAANTHMRMQALYVAEAGLERARAVLNSSTQELDLVLAGATPAADQRPTALDPATGRPNGIGVLLMDGGAALRDVPFPPAPFGRGPAAAVGATPALMGWYTVWIRNDTGECRQGLFTDDRNGAVVVRVQAVAIDARTNVVLEVTLSPTAPFATTPTNGGRPPVLCPAGKNACDDNSSTVFGVTAD